MKYFLRVLLTLVIAVAAVVGVYTYTNGGINFSDTVSSDTTATKIAATEKNGNKKLVASIKDKNYYLYKSGDTVIFEHNSNSGEFSNWNMLENEEKPTMVCDDFDSDDKDEVLVRCVSSVDADSEEKIYNLYMIDISTDKKGKETYTVTQASRDTWSNILDNVIKEELTQLKSCNKIAQFAMNYNSKAIAYDKATGLVKDYGGVGYFKTLQDNNGKYLTIDKWYKGNGIYKVSKKNVISVSIAVNVSYKNSDLVQQAGAISFEIGYSEDGGFSPEGNSLEFSSESDYKVSNQTDPPQKQWSYTENNIDKAVSKTDTVIDWISYNTDYDSSVTTQSKSFAAENTDVNALSKIVVKNDCVELTAKKGMTFDSNSASKNEFSVIINEGEEDEYEISYTASVDKSGKNQVLKINFDRSYSRKEIKKIKINFGVK